MCKCPVETKIIVVKYVFGTDVTKYVFMQNIFFSITRKVLYFPNNIGNPTHDHVKGNTILNYYCKAVNYLPVKHNMEINRLTVNIVSDPEVTRQHDRDALFYLLSRQ